MTALQRRFKSVLERIGDDFVSDSGAGKGVFAVLPVERAGDFLTSAELEAAGRPIRFAYVPFDDGTEKEDEVSWNGLTLEVVKAVDLTAMGETVARMVVLA